MEGLRRAYGIAEPVRRGMELKIVKDGSFRPAVLGGAIGGNVHEDILVLGGRETEVGWEDVFVGLFLLFLLVRVWVDADCLLQETSSENRLVSMMRWRRGCGWSFRFGCGLFTGFVRLVCGGIDSYLVWLNLWLDCLCIQCI